MNDFYKQHIFLVRGTQKKVKQNSMQHVRHRFLLKSVKSFRRESFICTHTQHTARAHTHTEHIHSADEYYSFILYYIHLETFSLCLNRESTNELYVTFNVIEGNEER